MTAHPLILHIHGMCTAIARDNSEHRYHTFTPFQAGALWFQTLTSTTHIMRINLCGERQFIITLERGAH